MEAAVALCLPALGVKEPAGSLLFWGSGQKSTIEKLCSVALSTAGAVSTRPAVQRKREQRADDRFGVRPSAWSAALTIWGARRVPVEGYPGCTGCSPTEWSPEPGKMLHLPLPRSGRAANFPRR